MTGQTDTARLGMQVTQQSTQLAGPQPALAEVHVPPEGAVREETAEPPTRPDGGSQTVRRNNTGRRSDGVTPADGQTANTGRRSDKITPTDGQAE